MLKYVHLAHIFLFVCLVLLALEPSQARPPMMLEPETNSRGSFAKTFESENPAGHMASSDGPETFKRPLPLYTLKSSPAHQALFFSAYYRTNETWRAYPQMNAEPISPSGAPLMYITKLVSNVGGLQVIAEDQSDISQLGVPDMSDEFEDVELARDLDDMSFLVHDMESEATGRPCLCGCAKREYPSEYDDYNAAEWKPKLASDMENGSLARYIEYMRPAAMRDSSDSSEEATLKVHAEPKRATSDDSGRSELLEIADLCGDLLADLLQGCQHAADNATDDVSTFSMEEFYIWDSFYPECALAAADSHATTSDFGT